MSAREKFFSPASLLRVVKAVEWEDDLVVYPDGSSNQGRFMEALAILYGRWLFDQTLEETVAMAELIASDQWVRAFEEVVATLPQKIRQIVGFWRGLGGEIIRRIPEPSRNIFGWQIPEAPPRASVEDRCYRVVEQLVRELSSILEEVTSWQR